MHLLISIGVLRNDTCVESHGPFVYKFQSEMRDLFGSLLKTLERQPHIGILHYWYGLGNQNSNVTKSWVHANYDGGTKIIMK